MLHKGSLCYFTKQRQSNQKPQSSSFMHHKLVIIFVESQLKEARFMAEDADRKYDEVFIYSQLEQLTRVGCTGWVYIDLT